MSSKKVERIIARFDEWIDTVSSRYGVPAAAIKAILYQEMTMMDASDLAADFVVRFFPRFKDDSSTGYAQIFGRVGLEAVNFAVDRGLASYESLRLDVGHRLDPDNPADVRMIWLELHRDQKANIEAATLNLLMAANEMAGRTDFASFDDAELKLVFTRYNADVKRVTPYGERAFEHFKRYSAG